MDTLEIIKAVFDTELLEQGSFRNYYFNGEYAGRVLNGCLECEFNELDQYNHARLAGIKAALCDLDERAHAHIQEKFPTDDAGELKLDDLILQPNGNFKLGYYTGRTPMGETYLYVSFNPDFIMDDEIIVEGY